MGMRLVLLVFFLSVLHFSVFDLSLLSASDGGNQPAIVPRARFSADDFDWRNIIPHLLKATDLPADQALKEVLENSRVLRTYVANEIRAECGRDPSACSADGDDSARDGDVNEEVKQRIDKIVERGMFHRNHAAIVDYTLDHQPFPFSEISAVKGEKHKDTYLMLKLADRSYTAAQVQEKYGAPSDTSIAQWYSVYMYRLDDAEYAGRATFEIDPVDGAVVKVAVSLKLKKRHQAAR